MSIFKGRRNLGLLLLGVWLIATGLAGLIHLDFLLMDKILAEQNFSNSNRADPASAVGQGQASTMLGRFRIKGGLQGPRRSGIVVCLGSSVGRAAHS